MRSPGELTTLFRSKGLKVTPQRELVFRIMHGNTTHPTAEAVYGEAVRTMPTMSLKTVYQVLNDLRGLGELQTVDFGGGATRFEPNLDEHHHLICEGCGVVYDVEVETSDLALPRSQKHGFTVAGVDVIFRGTCRDCRS